TRQLPDGSITVVDMSAVGWFLTILRGGRIAPRNLPKHQHLLSTQQTLYEGLDLSVIDTSHFLGVIEISNGTRLAKQHEPIALELQLTGMRAHVFNVHRTLVHGPIGSIAIGRVENRLLPRHHVLDSRIDSRHTTALLRRPHCPRRRWWR